MRGTLTLPLAEPRGDPLPEGEGQSRLSAQEAIKSWC